MSWDNSRGGRTAESESTVESLTDDHEIGLSDTEGGSGESDLIDEVRNFSLTEIHEPVYD